MTLDYQGINFSELSDDSVVIIRKRGISSELMKEKINEVFPSYSRIFHEGLYNSQIIGPHKNYDHWFKEGFPSRILQPEEHWKEGKIRLRVVAEFIPNEPEGAATDRPIEPSLDAFREST